MMCRLKKILSVFIQKGKEFRELNLDAVEILVSTKFISLRTNPNLFSRQEVVTIIVLMICKHLLTGSIPL